MVTFDEIFAAAGAGRKVATNSKALLKKNYSWPGRKKQSANFDH